MAVYADRPHLRALMREDAEAAGFRLGEVAGIGALLEGEARPLGEVVLLDCPEVDGASLAALARLDMRVAHAGAQLVVSTTVAALDGAILDTAASRDSYALGLRLTVGLSVGAAIVVGVIRIIKGWPIQWFILGGYVGVVIMTAFAPPDIIGIAYDSGGVTTSTVTVPLVTALGVGLASSIRGRNPMIDGFGLIAFASLTPMIFVMGYGIFA